MEELSTKLERLRMRAQAALERPDARDEAIALLDAIVAEAPRGSEEALSAHRQLAELRIENHPWRAALHLRALREGGADDDSVHGLLGLCHALLGNFVAAAAAYRRALELSPRNPWYHHNLGHVLDAALGQSELALSHLTIAHGMEPEELEISASLAHCLARLGRVTEARELANETLGDAPANADHAALVEWIAEGAKGQDEFPVAKRAKMRSRSGSGTTSRRTEVRAVLRAKMLDADYSEREIEVAIQLWDAFEAARDPRVVKPEVTAAAIEYASLLVHAGKGRSQASVARRYGVSPAALATRLAEVRDALDLVPGDRRYHQ